MWGWWKEGGGLIFSHKQLWKGVSCLHPLRRGLSWLWSRTGDSPPLQWWDMLHSCKVFWLVVWAWTMVSAAVDGRELILLAAGHWPVWHFASNQEICILFYAWLLPASSTNPPSHVSTTPLSIISLHLHLKYRNCYRSNMAYCKISVHFISLAGKLHVWLSAPAISMDPFLVSVRFSFTLTMIKWYSQIHCKMYFGALTKWHRYWFQHY